MEVKKNTESKVGILAKREESLKRQGRFSLSRRRPPFRLVLLGCKGSKERKLIREAKELGISGNKVVEA